MCVDCCRARHMKSEYQIKKYAYGGGSVVSLALGPLDTYIKAEPVKDEVGVPKCVFYPQNHAGRGRRNGAMGRRARAPTQDPK